ncbi:hypothetical protein [Sphingomonas hankookensis]|nr:hypothetical protein [Sphingomonas hankookensis]
MTTPAARLGTAASGIASFAATFDMLTAPSFTISHPAPVRESEQTTAVNADTDRLDAALAAFKKKMSMTPAERVRRDVLKSMNLTEEAVEALPPEERAEIEQKVAMEVARRVKVMEGGGSGTNLSRAGMIATPGCRNEPSDPIG